MANEVNLGFAWLHSKLSADSTLLSYAVGGIWRGYAPSGTITPFLVVAYQSGHDKLTMNGIRVLSHLLFQCRVSGPAIITTAIENASNRLDDLLKRTSGTTSGGIIDACYREETLYYNEVVVGEKWSNIGGLYRLIIEQT
jgi:hypothetical protein